MIPYTAFVEGEGKRVIQRLRKDILQEEANIFRLVLVRGSLWEEAVLRPASTCLNCYSISKSFTATAVGIACDQGLLSLEDPILPYLEAELPSAFDDRLRRVRVRHLLTHTMGNAEGYLFEADRYTYPERNWARLILSRPLAYEPGERFCYSNTHYYLLSCLLHRATGRSLLAFLQETLFVPLNIVGCAWETCPRGETMGATGLYISTADMAKLGLLYLQRGQWQGERIFSSHWAEEATRRQTPEAAYGYGFWIHPDGFEMNGAHGQTVRVDPGEKLILAAHAYLEAFDYQALLRRAGLLP